MLCEFPQNEECHPFIGTGDKPLFPSKPNTELMNDEWHNLLLLASHCWKEGDGEEEEKLLFLH